MQNKFQPRLEQKTIRRDVLQITKASTTSVDDAKPQKILGID